MRTLLLTALLITSSFSSEYSLKPIKIDNGLWCVFGDLMPPTKENKGFVSNVCWVDNGKDLILLDAGPTKVFAQELEKAIATTSPKKVGSVVITNYHDDRILAASYFQSKGAKVIAHANILTDIAANPQKFERLPKLLSAELYAGTALPRIDKTFNEPKLDLGSVILYKLTDIAETSSDIVAYMPKQKAVFTGNILFGERGLNYDKESHINGWLEALDKIDAMKPKYFIPGHGTKTDRSSFDVSKNYLSALYTQTKQAYEDGVELQQITKKVSMEEFSYLINYKDRHVQNLYNLYGHIEFERVK
jgi:cyclase